MAFGNSTFSLAGGAVSDIFGGIATRKQLEGQAAGLEFKAQGSRLQAGQFDRAAGFADLNATLTGVNTDIKEFQSQRAAYLGIGQLRADIAGAGFTEGGSAEDLLADSHSQAALQSAILEQQGLIDQAGYTEQAAGYRTSAEVSRLSAIADEQAAWRAREAGADAERNGYITGGLKALGSIATFGF